MCRYKQIVNKKFTDRTKEKIVLKILSRADSKNRRKSKRKGV